MEISGSGNALRGYQVYSRAAATEQLAAAAAVQSVRASSQIGFKLGKFGVSYETEESAPTADVLSGVRSSMAKGQQTVAPDLETAGLRRQVSTASQVDGADDSQWMRRYGAAAYQRSDSAYRSQQAVSMLQATV